MAGNELTLQLINSGVTIGNNGIVSESMTLNQAILNSGEFKLGGCIASCFCLQVFDSGITLKDEEIQVYFKAEGTQENIPLFHGKITETNKNNDTGTVNIVAYDALGIAGDKQAYIPPILLRNVFQTVINDLNRKSGIDVAYDRSIYYAIDAKYNVGPGYYSKPMTIAEALSGICEMLGGFGLIDSEGVFRLVEIHQGRSGELVKVDDSAASEIHLYTDDKKTNLKVGAGKTYIINSESTSGETSGNNGLVNVGFYDDYGDILDSVSGYTPFTFIVPNREYENVSYVTLTTYYSSSNWYDTWTWEEIKENNKVDVVPMPKTKHEDYVTDTITGVQYFYKNEEGATEKYETRLFGSEENPYTLTSGMFKSVVQKDEIAKQLYEKIKNIPQFTPIKSMPSLGYPGIVNVGDMVSNGNITTFVFERTLTGIQGLKDKYIADVDKNMPVVDASEDTVAY